MIRKSGLMAIPSTLMTVVLTASLSLLTLHFKDILQDSYQSKLRQVADITAHTLKNNIEFHRDKLFDFHTLATDIGSSSSLRVTIVDQTGVVLGDSQVAHYNLDHMENHGSRPEIRAAMEHGQGLSKRYSSTLGYDLMYYSVKISARNVHEHSAPEQGSHKKHLKPGSASQDERLQTFVVRTALALNIFDQKMLWIWVWVAGISTLGVLVVIMISRFFSNMLDRQAAGEREVLESEVRERTHELSLMQRLGSLMSACTTVDSAANVVHPIAGRLLPGCSGGAITLIKSSRNRLDLLTQWGEKWQGSERFEPSDCWALLKGHTHFSFEDGLEIHCNHSINDKDSCQVCIPLVAQGETLGVLHLNYRDQASLEAGTSKAESMAEQIGLALANMRLREDLRQQAIRDPLTGLYNRRHMMEFLEQRICNADTQNAPLSVMLIDLDHFKRFNDTFGHDAGDYVLKQVAMELKQATRETDLVCRYGGEELCIVCPDTELRATAELGRKLVARIAGQGMQFNGQSLGNITISMGVAARDNPETGLDILLKEADNALYKAKEQGRNRVVVHEVEAESTSQPQTDYDQQE